MADLLIENGADKTTRPFLIGCDDWIRRAKHVALINPADANALDERIRRERLEAGEHYPISPEYKMKGDTPILCRCGHVLKSDYRISEPLLHEVHLKHIIDMRKVDNERRIMF